MSDADELAKLAELRDKGVISKREFDKKKRDILRGKRSTRGGWWRLTLLVIVIGAVIVWIAVDENSPENQASLDTPACGSDEAKKAVAEALANNVASRLVNIKLLDLKNTKQVSYNASTHERVCSAEAYLNSGQEELSFKFFDLDPKKGSYLAHLIPCRAGIRWRM